MPSSPTIPEQQQQQQQQQQQPVPTTQATPSNGYHTPSAHTTSQSSRQYQSQYASPADEDRRTSVYRLRMPEPSPKRDHSSVLHDLVRSSRLSHNMNNAVDISPLQSPGKVTFNTPTPRLDSRRRLSAQPPPPPPVPTAQDYLESLQSSALVCNYCCVLAVC